MTKQNISPFLYSRLKSWSFKISYGLQHIKKVEPYTGMTHIFLYLFFPIYLSFWWAVLMSNKLLFDLVFHGLGFYWSVWWMKTSSSIVLFSVVDVLSRILQWYKSRGWFSSRCSPGSLEDVDLDFLNFHQFPQTRQQNDKMKNFIWICAALTAIFVTGKSHNSQTSALFYTSVTSWSLQL